MIELIQDVGPLFPVPSFIPLFDPDNATLFAVIFGLLEMVGFILLWSSIRRLRRVSRAFRKSEVTAPKGSHGAQSQ